MRAFDRALRIVDRHGHAIGIETTADLMFGKTFRPVCLEDSCGWRGGFIATVGRAQDVGAEHHDKTAGVWEPAR